MINVIYCLSIIIIFLKIYETYLMYVVSTCVELELKLNLEQNRLRMSKSILSYRINEMCVDVSNQINSNNNFKINAITWVAISVLLGVVKSYII